MRAIECIEYGPPSKLVLHQKNISPGKGEIRVKIMASSVNFPDTLIIQGLYQFKAIPPFTPGSEFAGIVIETGEAANKWKPGDEVFGAVLTGAFAEEIVVSETDVISKPKEIAFSTAATLLMAYGTSYYALRQRANLTKGETLLVLGASGGVGLAAVEIGKLLGAKVIAVTSSHQKAKVCREKGADATIDCNSQDLKAEVHRITGDKGADVIYDPVGGKYSEAAFRSIAWRGRHLVIGFVSGIPSLSLNLPLLKGASVVGVFWGSHIFREPAIHKSNLSQLVNWCLESKINPHIDKEYPLEETALALQAIINRESKGKIVINPNLK